MVNHIVTLLFTTTGLNIFDIEKNFAGINTEVYILYLIYRLFNMLQGEWFLKLKFLFFVI